MEKYKICLIVPYFGQFPSFINLFLSSCAFNFTIDWIIFTDNIINNPPKNVRVVNIKFSDFKNFVQSKFNFDISLSTSYKICDYRPAYGYIFEDYLHEYDFWGHCDIDLIFGNIRKFIKNDILDRYDKVLRHGHFSLYRNKYDVNRWFKYLKPIDENYSYNRIYTSDDSFAYDEFGGKSSWGGILKMIRNAGIDIFDHIVFDDIRYNQYSFYSSRLIKGQNYTLKQLSKFPSYYSFNKGLLLRHILLGNEICTSESLYIHLQKRTMTLHTGVNLEEFIIVPNKFIPASINTQEILYEARCRRIYFSYIIIRFNNMVRKIKKYFKNISI